MHQIIYKTLIIIDKIDTSPFLKDRLNRLFFEFPPQEDIKVNYKTFENLKFDRKTKRYENAIKIAKLILLNYSPDIISGKNNVLAILFNMNDLWEQYVFVKLKKYANKNGLKVYAQRSKQFWNYRLLKPDILLIKGGEKYIIDTKWKNVRNKDVSTQDLRQIFAYNEFWQAKKGMLLYPDINGIEDFEGEYKKPVADTHFCKIGFIKVEENNDDFAEKIIDKLLPFKNKQSSKL